MSESIADYLYELPPDRIAQHPLPQRDGSRLLYVPRESGAPVHTGFLDLPQRLAPGDLLVVNEVRVRPARLVGRRATGGRVECLVLQDLGDGLREVLMKSARAPRSGERLVFEEGHLGALVVESHGGGRWTLRFEVGDELAGELERYGRAPLPPYIKRGGFEDPDRSVDLERYQTIYARGRGSAIAAPTAGLHFTDRLLAALESRGIGLARLTLEVGEGTFRPVSVERLCDHVMHSERYDLPVETADRIERTRDAGGRIVAVGTTTCRVLEACAGLDGRLVSGKGSTDLFIRPPYRFRAVDGLVTNFHLPGSTLLVLVAALAGRERILDAYRGAVETGYRFYSYGDAMLIL